MLNNWLKPLAQSAINNYKKAKENSLASHLYKNIQSDDPIDQQVALIFSCSQADQIRSSFADFEFRGSNINIIDLGDIRNKDFSFPIPMLKELIENNTIPIIIADSIKYSLTLSKTLELIFLDFQLSIATDKLNKVNELKDLLTLNNLKSISGLAFQKHFNNPNYLKIPKWKESSSLSLGQIRDDFTELEPVLRNVNALSFDTSCVRHSDFPSSNQNPCGLFAEEACKLFNYLGMAEQIKGIHLHGFDSSAELPISNVKLLATMIWYFLDGLSKRKHDLDNQQDLIKYKVTINDKIDAISFWKSPSSNRWWVEVPNGISDKKDFVPCTENEYKMACKDIISDRLFKIFYS